MQKLFLFPDLRNVVVAVIVQNTCAWARHVGSFLYCLWEALRASLLSFWLCQSARRCSREGEARRHALLPGPPVFCLVFREVFARSSCRGQEKKDASAMLKILEVFQILGKVDLAIWRPSGLSRFVLFLPVFHYLSLSLSLSVSLSLSTCSASLPSGTFCSVALSQLLSFASQILLVF